MGWSSKYFLFHPFSGAFCLLLVFWNVGGAPSSDCLLQPGNPGNPLTWLFFWWDFWDIGPYQVIFWLCWKKTQGWIQCRGDIPSDIEHPNRVWNSGFEWSRLNDCQQISVDPLHQSCHPHLSIKTYLIQPYFGLWNMYDFDVSCSIFVIPKH